MTGFTKVSNDIFDLMPKMKPNEWKLFIFVYRMTVGYNRTSCKLSYSELKDGTGISSKTTLLAAISGIKEYGVTIKDGEAHYTDDAPEVQKLYHGGTEIVPPDDAPEVQKLYHDRYRNCTTTGTEVVPSTTGLKKNKRKLKRRDAHAQAPKFNPRPETKKLCRSFSIPFPSCENEEILLNQPGVRVWINATMSQSGVVNWPGYGKLDKIILVLNDGGDKETLHRVFMWWVSKNYNRGNVDGILDRYLNEMDNRLSPTSADPAWQMVVKAAEAGDSGLLVGEDVRNAVRPFWRDIIGRRNGEILKYKDRFLESYRS